MTFFATLFVIGFAYGAFAGNAKMNWLVRSMCGGLFFSFFYIAIPVVMYQEWSAGRRQ